MDSSQPTQSILDTLRTVEFRLGLKGYNVDEVDEYLEKAAVEAEAVMEQVRQANERLRQANERTAQLEAELRNAAASPQPAAEQSPAAPAEPAVSDDTLQRTLLLAQKFVDQTRRESEAEASEVVARAEERARSIVAHAEERARQMSTDAERRLREDVTRLESLRTQLSTDVENMARHLEAERNKIRSSLTEVLKWVDEHVQPASSLASLRSRDARAGNGGSSDGGRPGGGQPQGAGVSGARRPGNQLDELLQEGRSAD